MVEFSEHSSTSKEKKFKLIKYFKIYSNLSSPFATSYPKCGFQQFARGLNER